MPDPGPARSRSALHLGAAVLIVGIALWLRFHRLGLFELWLDEAFSFEMAVTSQLREVLLRENNPPLYYLLQRFWLQLFGDSAAALRSLAAVFGTCFVAAVIAAGRQFLGTTAGLWAGAIAAFAPLQVYYAQEARAYSLLTLALLLSYMALWRALRVESRLAWAVFSGCTLLALATHYMAVLALVPAALLVWLWPERAGRGRRSRRYLVASTVGAAPWLCWVVWSFWVHPHPEGAHAWIERIWLNTPPAQAIPRSLEVLVLGSEAQLIPGFFKQFTLLAFPAPLRALGLVLIAGVGVWAVLPCGEGNAGIPWLARRKLWLCVLVALPLLILWSFSFVKPYYVVGRYDLIAFPAYVLVLGHGFAKLQRFGRAGAVAAFAVGLLLLVVLGSKLALYYEASSRPVGPSARATARALDAGVRDGDLVIFTPGRGMSVYYYLRGLGYERRDERCENPTSGRWFFCANVSFDDESTVLDFDHLDRTAYSPEALRGDLRGLLAQLDPARNTIWVEKRIGPSQWLAADRLLSQEAERAGYRRVAAPPPLRALRMWAHVAID